MTNIPHCFVVAFSRSGEGELRTVAAIKAANKQYARSAAFQMAAMNRGAIAFSKSGNTATGKWKNAEILAQFGDVPHDWALTKQLELWDLGLLQITHARPFANDASGGSVTAQAVN